MLDEALEEWAALYVSGALPAPEREKFELVLDFHGPVRALVFGLENVAAATVLERASCGRAEVFPRLKTRVLQAIEQRAQSKPEGLVVTDPAGLVEWVNPAFTGICGYTNDDVRGRKLGPFLQGEGTERDAAERMRAAVHAFRPCTEELTNYDKQGRPYRVWIQILPISDPRGTPRWLIGREREIAHLAS